MRRIIDWCDAHESGVSVTCLVITVAALIFGMDLLANAVNG